MTDGRERGSRYTSLNARGEFELARAAGFDTYDDFLRWKQEKPDEYERWYAELKARAFADPDAEWTP